MTSDELKKLLEARAIIDTPNICNSCYAEGFRNAFDIMWPLVEALEEIKTMEGVQINYRAHAKKTGKPLYNHNLTASQALKDLEQKLKGTE